MTTLRSKVVLVSFLAAVALVPAAAGVLTAGERLGPKEGELRGVWRYLDPKGPPMRSLASGTPKVLFLTGADGWGVTDQPNELLRHLDMDYYSVHFDRYWDSNCWPQYGGIGLPDSKSVHDFSLVQENFLKVLRSDRTFDVIFIPASNGWNFFTKEIRAEIRKRVEAGAGLVLVHPIEGPPEKDSDFKEISPILPLGTEMVGQRFYPVTSRGTLATGKWRRETSHYITSGIPWDLFPEGNLQHYRAAAAGEVLARAGDDPLVAVRTLGKGRVVGLNYFVIRGYIPDVFEEWMSSCEGKEWIYWVNPPAVPANLSIFRPFFYELLARCIVWAGGKEPEVTLVEIAPGVSRMSPFYSLGQATDMQRRAYGYVRNDGEEQDVRVLVKWQDSRGSEVARRESDLHLKEGLQPVFVPLPDLELPRGTNIVDVELRKDDKTLDWAAFTVDVEPEARIQSVVMDSDIFRVGDVLRGKVRLDGLRGESFDLLAEVVDKERRVVGTTREHVTFPPGAGPRGEAEAALAIAMRWPVTVSNSLRLTVLDGRGVQMNRQDEAARLYLYRTPEERAVTDILERETDREEVIYTRYIGFGPYWYDSADLVQAYKKHLETGDKRYLVRKPCLDDPKFLDFAAGDIGEEARRYYKQSPLGYIIAHEASLAMYSGPIDFCFSDYSLKAFREWLKKDVYKSLDALNTEWGTQFKGWDEVMPMTWQEARKQGRYAAWADHRAFGDETLVGYAKRQRDVMRKIDPGAQIGMWGTQTVTAHNGFDWSRIYPIAGVMQPYDVGEQPAMAYSFNPKVFVEQNWVFLPRKEFARTGAGKMLLESRRDPTGIAIHYSMPSLRGVWIAEGPDEPSDKSDPEGWWQLGFRERGSKPSYDNNRQGWFLALRDLGYQLEFVTNTAIESGRLTGDIPYRVLILNHAIAMSSAEAQAIRHFVESGGLVIADFRTGLMNEHCTWNKTGALDKLFGIERTGEFFGKLDVPGKPTAAPDEKALEKAAPVLELLEPGIRLAGGKTLVSVGDTPGIVVRRVGKGLAVYLNFGLITYKRDREKELGAAIREALRTVFELASVSPPALVTDSEGRQISGLESIYWTKGRHRYLAVYRPEKTNIVVTQMGMGVTVQEADKTPDELPISIRLKERPCVYDVRARKYLGVTGVVPEKVKRGESVLLALLPNEVTGVTVTPDSERVSLGEAAKLRVRVSSRGWTREDHVVKLDVVGPDGKPRWYYCRSYDLTGGRGTIETPFAYNDLPGSWKITVTDVASGASAETSLTLAERTRR